MPCACTSTAKRKACSQQPQIAPCHETLYSLIPCVCPCDGVSMRTGTCFPPTFGATHRLWLPPRVPQYEVAPRYEVRFTAQPHAVSPVWLRRCAAQLVSTCGAGRPRCTSTPLDVLGAFRHPALRGDDVRVCYDVRVCCGDSTASPVAAQSWNGATRRHLSLTRPSTAKTREDARADRLALRTRAGSHGGGVVVLRRCSRRSLDARPHCAGWPTACRPVRRVGRRSARPARP